MKRIAFIQDRVDMDTAGVKTINIDLTEVISRIEFAWRCTNVTVSVMLAEIEACLSKIELIDGAEVLYSLSAGEMRGLNFYDSGGVMPRTGISLTVGGYFEIVAQMNFGRYLWDKLYAFDPKRYVNPQLRITWDEDACNAAVVVNQLSILAYVDDAPGATPVGFLGAKEVHSFVMAASTTTYVDLPTDLPIRKILFQPYSQATDPIALLSTLKIAIDNDRLVLLNMDAAEYGKLLQSMYARVVEYYTLDNAITAKTLFVTPSKDVGISIEYSVDAVTAAGQFAGVTWTSHKLALAASVAIKGMTAVVMGILPCNTFPVLFGDQYEPTTWLVPPKDGSLKQTIVSSAAAAATATFRTVVQQVRTR